MSVSSSNLKVGDIIVVEKGVRVPADLVLLRYIIQLHIYIVHHSILCFQDYGELWCLFYPNRSAGWRDRLETSSCCSTHPEIGHGPGPPQGSGRITLPNF